MNLRVSANQLTVRGQPGGPLVGRPELSNPRKRLRRAMITGLAVLGAFIAAAVAWTMTVSIAGTASASGQITATGSTRMVRRLEAGTIQQVLVHNGDAVKTGQLLVQFETTAPAASVSVLRNQYFYYLAQQARFSAEAHDSTSIAFPAELVAAASDPSIASLMRDQSALILSRRQTYDAQGGVLKQRIEQMKSREAGLQAQIQANKDQSKLISDELKDIQKLYNQGFAPKSQLLSLQRTTASLQGDYGNLIGQLNAMREQEGETRISLEQLRAQRQTEISNGLTEAGTKLADIQPKLDAAKDSLDSASVRAPINGYIMNMSPVGPGMVAGGGEQLMEVVPDDQPLMISAKLRPQDAHEVAPGMRARVTLAGMPRTKMRYLEGIVTSISADALKGAPEAGAVRGGSPQGGSSQPSASTYFAVDVKLDPAELKKLPGVRLTPGLPASVMIVTRERRIFDFLFGPVTDAVSTALTEN